MTAHFALTSPSHTVSCGVFIISTSHVLKYAHCFAMFPRCRLSIGAASWQRIDWLTSFVLVKGSSGVALPWESSVPLNEFFRSQADGIEMLPYFGQLQRVELQCDVGSEDSPCVCLWAEEDIVSSKIMRAVEDRPEELMMSFGNQILQYVTDETKLRAPLEERGRMIDVANLASKYYAALPEMWLFSMDSATGMAATFAKDDTQPENPRQPFSKCLVDISKNLFANIVWPVDTAVAPELAGGVVFFSCLSATEHISGSFTAPRNTEKTIKQRLWPNTGEARRLAARGLFAARLCVYRAQHGQAHSICWMGEPLPL